MRVERAGHGPARLGIGASGLPLDAPLLEISETTAGKSGQAQLVAYARRTGATARKLSRKVGGQAALG
ncbi:hypothetical protein [Methylobacterium trifolii]|uniref:Uncharacterized protein n=1 Tax=Methylobacterium trifolii TaxID=1003092 RepID=A0ABQ4U340_9HYPH|nr:hypothetical protein [Methylobacterium trifolii]GJE61562.1 hypothetical protein MPOCJGCO_3684 [Methylobacterium trifolii]